MGALVHRLALRADPLPGRVFSLFKLDGHKCNYKDAGSEPTEVELNPNLKGHGVDTRLTAADHFSL